ncbi:MAG: YjbH domain-containing protein, partial [Smithellaceae bacterium]
MLFPQNLAFAGDAPFTSPNNWGATGLMETPTARVLESGTFRVGVGYIDPYLYYYGAVSPLRGLEIDGHITEVLGTETGKDNPAWKGYGNFKDKYVGLKYQFLREGKYWP